MSVENPENEFIWSQKYRPSKLDDVVIPQAIKDEFKKFVNDKQITNLLLTSASPGTGKTTTAWALCHEMGIRPLFINASLDNSIDDIRGKVIQYATTVSLVSEGTKIIILDEGDRLSPNAQDALKGIIEEVSANCRFIVTANTKSRITEALMSRLNVIEFVFTNDDKLKVMAGMLKRSFEILTAENVPFKKEVVIQVVKRYVPDNRKLLNVLQQYAARTGTIDEGILGQLNSGDATVLVQAMKDKKFNDVKSWCADNADRLLDDFYAKLYRTLVPAITDQSEPQLILILGEEQKHHFTVPDKFIHFAQLCTKIMMEVQFKG